MKIASKRALDDMDIAAELRVHGATWDTSAKVLGHHKRVLNQIGTMRTKILRTSRARRNAPLCKGMCLVPEVVGAAPDDKLSLFPIAGGAGLESLNPGSGRSWGVRPSRLQKGGRDTRAPGNVYLCPSPPRRV